ncbi:hypothetical protein K456DRAFT_27932 [Colletotrichum gloeosporioides 23]|nr:hypothetical protein K456DRAFT_27932 [Colletotrichum gloeosporioides 23]
MSFSTEVVVAVALGVPGLIVAITSAVFAYLAVNQARDGRRRSDDVELQDASSLSSAYLRTHPSSNHSYYQHGREHRRVAADIHRSGWRGPYDFVFPGGSGHDDPSQHVVGPSSFHFDFRHTIYPYEKLRYRSDESIMLQSSY